MTTNCEGPECENVATLKLTTSGLLLGSVERQSLNACDDCMGKLVENLMSQTYPIWITIDPLEGRSQGDN